MRFGLTIVIILIILTTGTAQKTDLDHINEDKFQPEGRITGIGIVEIDLARRYYEKDLIVYDAEGKSKIVILVTDSDVTTRLGGKIYSRNDSTNPFSPRQFGNNPDYFRLIFDCTKSTDKYYQVIVDQKTNETGFIRKADSLFKFETVIEFVDEWTTLGLDFDRTVNPLISVLGTITCPPLFAILSNIGCRSFPALR